MSMDIVRYSPIRLVLKHIRRPRAFSTRSKKIKELKRKTPQYTQLVSSTTSSTMQSNNYLHSSRNPSKKKKNKQTCPRSKKILQLTFIISLMKKMFKKWKV